MRNRSPLPQGGGDEEFALGLLLLDELDNGDGELLLLLGGGELTGLDDDEDEDGWDCEDEDHDKLLLSRRGGDIYGNSAKRVFIDVFPRPWPLGALLDGMGLSGGGGPAA